MDVATLEKKFTLSEAGGIRRLLYRWQWTVDIYSPDIMHSARRLTYN